MDEFSVVTVKELFESEIDGLRELVEKEKDQEKNFMIIDFNQVIRESDEY